MRARCACLVAMPILIGCVVSCSSAPPPASANRKVASPKDAGAEAAPSDPRWLHGQVIAEVPEGTFGPYVSYGAQSAIALYAPSGGKERRWIAQPLNDKGVPTGKAKDVARAPDDAPVVVIRQAAANDGFVALWVRKLDHGSALESIALDTTGLARSEAVTIAQVTGQIVWAEALPSASGPIVFWAEQRRDKAAISSARLDAQGKTASAATLLAPAARAWQVTSTSAGAALAMVRPGEAAGSGATVALQLLDGWGRPAGQAVAISESPTASLDVDVIRLGTALVFAWTDRRDLDNHVYVAATDMNGKVTAPAHALTPPLGEQSFISLIAPRGSGDAMLVFEEVSQRAPQRRAIRLTTIDARSVAGARTLALDYQATDRDLPEISASSDGFVALTNAPTCTSGRPCEAGAPMASYVRVDPKLNVIGSSPLLVDKLAGHAPANAWGLGCMRDQCHALVTGFTAPAPVVGVPLPSRKGTFAAPVADVASPAPPYLVSNQVVRSMDEHLSEVAAAQVGDKTLVGWVTYFVEPPPGTAAAAAPKPAKLPADPAAIPGDPSKPTAANLSVIALDPSGKSAPAPTIISVRALSVGGVSIAAGAPANKDACLAWVARDAGDPQVFVTRVTAEGKRDVQQMLTRAKGDASDTAIAWAGDGWVVAWVDGRDGNGEVYAAKVDRNLRKVVQDTRITNAAGDASDVGLFARGSEVYVTWSDPRDNAHDGHGDPYVQKLNGANLAKMGQEVRLDQSSLHARSVHISASGQDLVAGWLAQPLNDAPTDRTKPPGPRFTRIDAKTAAPVGDLVTLKWEAGRNPTSFAFTCTDDVCKGILAGSQSDLLRADAILWFPSSPAMQSKPVSALTGPPGEDISPTVIGDSVIFTDDASVGDVRIRRAKLAWVTQ